MENNIKPDGIFFYTKKLRESTEAIFMAAKEGYVREKEQADLYFEAQDFDGYFLCMGRAERHSSIMKAYAQTVGARLNEIRKNLPIN